MIKTIFILLLGVLVLGGGGWFYSNFTKYAPKRYITENETATDTTSSTETAKPSVTTTDTGTGRTTPGAPVYTMAQVATHADATSCYSVISGVVYDLTMWVNMHPGGQSPILSICGKDGTTPFMNQHHGAMKQMNILARFKIGLVAQ